MRPDRYIEINNFYTATVYEKGAEVVRMLATLIGAGRVPQAAWTSTSTATTARRRRSSSSSPASPKCRSAISTQFMTLVRAGRHAGTRVHAARTMRKSETAELTIEQVLPPTPGQPKKQPMHIPLRLGLLGATAAICRSPR